MNHVDGSRSSTQFATSRRAARAASKAVPRRLATGFSAIAGIGCWVPARTKTLEEMLVELKEPIGSAVTALRNMGLLEKRVLDPKELMTPEQCADLDAHPEKLTHYKRLSIVEMGVAAAKKLFEQGTYDGEPIDKDEIDLVIFCSVARAYAEPATAVIVQERLGLRGASAFDLSNACLGFTDAWLVADSMIASGRIGSALIVASEPATHIGDMCLELVNDGAGESKEYLAGLSLGDGAVAALVRAKRPGAREIALVTSSRETVSQHHELCVLPSIYEPMVTHGRRLLEKGVLHIVPVAQFVLEGTKWALEDLDACVTHQASMPAADAAMSFLSMPAKTNVFHTFPRYGNMSSVSAPFTLAKYIESRGDWRSDKILYLGLGSGIGVAALTLQT